MSYETEKRDTIRTATMLARETFDFTDAIVIITAAMNVAVADERKRCAGLLGGFKDDGPDIHPTQGTFNRIIDEFIQAIKSGDKS